MSETFSHVVIRGGRRGDREAAASALGLPPRLMPVVDAHAGLRGPYTAGGSIVRAVAEEALVRWPELVHRHDIEIRAVAPELVEVVPVRRETLYNRAAPEQRTRIHSRYRTLRIAHGLVDLLREHLSRLGGGPRTLVVENLDHADHTDHELVAVMLRRLHPELLTVVVGVGDGPLGQPLEPVLSRHARTVTATGSGAGRPADGPDESALAELYLASAGTTDVVGARAAYERLTPERRAASHDAHAARLVASADRSQRLGAVLFHLERGSDPRHAGAQALSEALDHCAETGFHHACVDLARRGRAVTDPHDAGDRWWEFTRRLAMSLTLLGRGKEAEALWDEARTASSDPVVHRTAAYETAMLYARHHSPDRHDYPRATAWINQALAFAATLDDQRDRAFYTVFYRNGAALIRMRLGDLDGALRLVNDALALMDQVLPPDDRPLDRCSLLSNKARLLLMLGRGEEALGAYDQLVEVDPDYAEYHFDRANALHDMGRAGEALAGYDRAVELCLPFPEVFYNRAQLHIATGDLAAALADLDRVLELDPAFLDGYVNRAGLRASMGDLPGARADVADGLGIAPGDPHLLCVLGQVEMADGRYEAAGHAFDTAIATAPDLAVAWGSRATLRYEMGDLEGAIEDLTRALAIEEDVPLLVNRATALRAAGRVTDAEADLSRALELGQDARDATTQLADIRSTAV